MPATHPPIRCSQLIKAPAEQLYGIISDYRNGHPRILPHPYFSDLVVERGGIGNGTEITFQMHMLGATRTLHAMISEPDPGHILSETYPASGIVTTFYVEPIKDELTRVTITTELPEGSGALSSLQRFVMGIMLPRIYAKELGLLSSIAQTWSYS